MASQAISSFLLVVNTFTNIFLAATCPPTEPCPSIDPALPAGPATTVITYVSTTISSLPVSPSGCTTNTEGRPVPTGVLTNFAIQVQNTSHPEIHNRLLNRWDTESEDRNLYLSPAGSYTLDFQSKDGILSWGNLEMVINGEWTPEDNTTKMFMTNRVEDPRAIFDIIYGCSPENVLQQELRLNARGTSHGGDVCVRLTTGDRYELRYSPPGNTPVALKTGAVCIKVTLAIVQLKDPPRRL